MHIYKEFCYVIAYGRFLMFSLFIQCLLRSLLSFLCWMRCRLRTPRAVRERNWMAIKTRQFLRIPTTLPARASRLTTTIDSDNTSRRVVGEFHMRKVSLNERTCRRHIKHLKSDYKHFIIIIIFLIILRELLTRYHNIL
jgi:hypothetical protein